MRPRAASCERAAGPEECLLFSYILLAKARLRGLCALQPCTRSHVGGVLENQATQAGQHLAEHSPGVPPRPTAQGVQRATQADTQHLLTVLLVFRAAKHAVCATPHPQPLPLLRQLLVLLVGAGGKPRPGEDHLPAMPLPRPVHGRACAWREVTGGTRFRVRGRGMSAALVGAGRAWWGGGRRRDERLRTESRWSVHTGYEPLSPTQKTP
jgi:hypothetical protein